MTEEKAVSVKQKSKKKGQSDRIPYISSLRFKLTICFIICVFITSFFLITVIVTQIRKTLKDQTSNYMYDMAVSYGKELENLDEI